MSQYAHDRLLEAAEALIVERGVNALSTDAVLERANAGRRTLYTHFGSKEELIVQALRRRDDRLMAWFAHVADVAEDDPEAPVRALFSALGRWFGEPDFNGCAFVATVAGVDRAGRAGDAALRFKARFRALIARLVDEGGFCEPDRLVRKLLIIAEGATVAALIDPTMRSGDDAVDLASAVLMQHGRAVPR